MSVIFLVHASANWEAHHATWLTRDVCRMKFFRARKHSWLSRNVRLIRLDNKIRF